MKKRIYTVLGEILIAICLFTMACQPTPEEEAVVQKNQQQMLQQAKGTGSDLIAGEDMYERLGAPRQYESTLSGTDGRLTVTVNARVLLPEQDLPIVRVAPDDFSMEQIKCFAKALIPPTSRYVDPKSELSRGYYNHSIQKLRWAIDNWSDGGSFLYEDLYSSIEEANLGLVELLTIQSNAPERMPDFDINSIPCANGYPEKSRLGLLTTTDDISYSEMSICNLRRDYGDAYITYERDQFCNYLIAITNSRESAPSFSSKQAESSALELMSKLPIGRDEFSCSAIIPTFYDDAYFNQIPCYHFIFTRAFGSVVETATDAKKTEDEFNKSWIYEKIHIIIDESGLAAFRYDCPCSILEVINEQANLLPFSKIKNIFEKRITVYRNNLTDGSHDNLRVEYCITSIKLGLVSIREENAETGLLVPAWDFMGYERYWENDGKEQKSFSPEIHSFLCINAIDGSIIARGGV